MALLENLPADLHIEIGTGLYEFKRVRELDDRRLYLYGTIASVDEEEMGLYYDASMTGKLVENIFDFNRMDEGSPIEERRPIRLYINSPGGEVVEGFALVDAINLSKMPIYTINVGEWCSMAFLIGIAGTKRFSLPSATFMMHEPSGLVVGKFSDMADKVKFNQRYGEKVIKRYVLAHSKMTSAEYDEKTGKDFHMLPEDALRYGFIDEIVSDLSQIL